MNNKTVSISGFVVLFIVLMFGAVSMDAKPVDNDKRAALTDSEMQWRIDNLMGPFDYRYTSRVKSEVESYVFDYRKGAEELLGRVTIYFPIFEQKILEKDLPREIKYLSVIESSLRVNAYSRVGAAGLWQFMRGTAREYGLTVNRSVDQRYAVEESTEAALTYLSNLYDQFGDWTLALAAYNCGPGNVRKAMRRSGKSDYWSIRSYLPQETRNYIPKFVAASYLMQYYYEHDLMPIRPDDYYFETLESKVYQHLSFKQIAQLTDTPLEIIKNLNPSYRKGFIPANTSGMKLILPRMSMYSLIEMKSEGQIKLVNNQPVNFNAYIRTNFEPEIASYLLIDQPTELSIERIPSRDLNFFLDASKKDLEKNSNQKLLSLLRYRKEQDEDKKYLQYRLKSGETLRDVSRKFKGVSIESIIRMNKINMDQSPPPGTLLRIRQKN
jgi:membrane-bound lytic murein transglycosylase D